MEFSKSNGISSNSPSKLLLIERILERGQRLRQSMVQSILSNDNDQGYNERGGKVRWAPKVESLEQQVVCFLRGDELPEQDEAAVLRKLQSMSGTELCSITNVAYRGANDYDYSVPTCYYDSAPYQELSPANIPYFEHINSLKLFVKSVNLNEAGFKKVATIVGHKSSSCCFFVEYEIPKIVSNRQAKLKSLVDSGRNRDNSVRCCSRQSVVGQSTIPFNHTSTHTIHKLHKLKLRDVEIKFTVSCRCYKQSLMLGCATFNFASFNCCQNLTFNCDLPLQLAEHTPLIVGRLTLSLELGCDKLYFGQEFLDFMCNKSTPLQHTTNKNYNISEQNTKSDLIKLKPLDEVQNKHIIYGFFYILQARFSKLISSKSYVTCQTFDQSEVCYSKLCPSGQNPATYNFSQLIPLIYEDSFLLKLRENYVVLEFWEKDEHKDRPLGITKLPLNCFYLAYRNPIIFKYLCQEELPVIGSDGWEVIYDITSDQAIGEVQVLLALGTKKQIDDLQDRRHLKQDIVKAELHTGNTKENDCSNKNKPARVVGKKINVAPVKKSYDNKQSQTNKISTTDISIQSDMDLANTAPVPVLTSSSDEDSTAAKLRTTSSLLETLQAALTVDHPPEKTFRVRVTIISALHLPVKKKCRSRKTRCKNGRHDDVLPSTYVTFEGSKDSTNVTSVVPKSTSPKWDYHCDCHLPLEFLTNDQKRLVFKVWRKSVNTTMVPNMQTDVVLGIASVDLTVLTSGLPYIQGWFNITDFSNKCNGQINIQVSPLEPLNKYHVQNATSPDSPPTPPLAGECPDEPAELLNRTLKRKFTELDEITQRLRLRLSKVTDDESDASNDEVADQFERDINTLCVEDDYDTIDFEKEALHFNLKWQKENGLLQIDQQLDRQRIDSLLEKLTLIATPRDDSSRHVSGASNSRLDSETILHDWDCTLADKAIDSESSNIV